MAWKLLLDPRGLSYQHHACSAVAYFGLRSDVIGIVMGYMFHILGTVSQQLHKNEQYKVSRKAITSTQNARKPFGGQWRALDIALPMFLKHSVKSDFLLVSSTNGHLALQTHWGS